MKNENLNLINVLLVVAIVLAVGGTWLNLNKLGEVKAVTLQGYAVAAREVAVPVVAEAPRSTEAVPMSGTEGISLVITDEEDCYVATYNDTTGLADTTPCSLDSSSNLTNTTLQLGANTNYNISAYWSNTIVGQFGAGSLNHQYFGWTLNTSGHLGTGTNLGLGTYINADSSSPVNMVLLFEDITNIPSRQNYSFNWATTWDFLTESGSYPNTANYVIHIGS